MLLTLEIAQTFAMENVIKHELFYKACLIPLNRPLSLLIANGILAEFKSFKFTVNSLKMVQIGTI
jgi:hypothetical protein